MELVYPIYLDIPMMSAFLASLQGGLVEEQNVETKSHDAKERVARASLAAKVGGLFSGVLGVEGGAELGRTVSQDLESQSTGTVRYPSASLFIRLRNLLLEQEMVKVLDSADAVREVAVGDMVEFVGAARPNPAHQIRRSLTQLFPLLDVYTKMNNVQLEQQLLALKEIRPGGSIQLGAERVTITDGKQAAARREAIKLQQQQAQAQLDVLQGTQSLLEGLLSSDVVDLVLFECDGFNVVCRVYPDLARGQRLQDLYDANWRCIGKVIRVIPEGESFDLLKGIPISYLAQSQFPLLAAALNNDNLRVEIGDSVIQGPAIVAATLALFA